MWMCVCGVHYQLSKEGVFLYFIESICIMQFFLFWLQIVFLTDDRFRSSFFFIHLLLISITCAANGQFDWSHQFCWLMLGNEIWLHQCRTKSHTKNVHGKDREQKKSEFHVSVCIVGPIRNFMHFKTVKIENLPISRDLITKKSIQHISYMDVSW